MYQQKERKQAEMPLCKGNRTQPAAFRQVRPIGAVCQGQGVIQRLADPVASGAEHPRPLTTAKVNTALGDQTEKNCILGEMVNQRNWVSEYQMRLAPVLEVKELVGDLPKQLWEHVKKINDAQLPAQVTPGSRDRLKVVSRDRSVRIAGLNGQMAAICTLAAAGTPLRAYQTTLNPAAALAAYQAAVNNANTANTTIQGIRGAANDNALNTAGVQLLTAAQTAKTVVNTLITQVAQDSRKIAQDALKSAINISSDLFVIRQVRDTVAEGDPEAQLPAAAPEPQGLRTPVRSKGQALSRQVKGKKKSETKKYIKDQHWSDETKAVVKLYYDAGVISNTARQAAGNVQRAMATIQKVIPGAVQAADAAHAHPPGAAAQLKMKTDIQLSLPAHGPAISEVDMFDAAHTSIGTVSKINDPQGRIPKSLHPLVAQDLMALTVHGNNDFNSYAALTKGAGSHAEIRAVNAALKVSGIGDGAQGEAAARARLFGRTARVPVLETDLKTMDSDEFLQCPHCAAALATITPAVFKPKGDYTTGLAARIQTILQPRYPALPQADLDTCAAALLDLSPANFVRANVALHLNTLTAAADQAANLTYADALIADPEAAKLHMAYQH